ncbi:hypothetical protein ACQPZG_31250 [Streptomyces sp. CA-294286]|uniref:hypothetical protein n=1 Tax=Streptomyces sp. CA-294286 TaxID=3240070 RepID=UPI003D8B0C18
MPGAEHAGDEEAPPEAVTAAAAQSRLRDWAEVELLSLRMQAAERKAVLLGHGCNCRRGAPVKGRLRLKTYDPGFSFPVLDDDVDPGDCPTRLHRASEMPEDPERGVPRLRRITYELGPFDVAARVVQDKKGRTWRGAIEGIQPPRASTASTLGASSARTPGHQARRPRSPAT